MRPLENAGSKQQQGLGQHDGGLDSDHAGGLVDLRAVIVAGQVGVEPLVEWHLVLKVQHHLRGSNANASASARSCLLSGPATER